MENKELRKLLLKIGISADLEGYFAIIEATKLYKKEMKITDLYQIISDILDTKPIRIERAIRYSIQTSYTKNKLLQKVYNKMPNNNSFISDLVYNFDVIKEEIYND